MDQRRNHERSKKSFEMNIKLFIRISGIQQKQSLEGNLLFNMCN